MSPTHKQSVAIGAFVLLLLSACGGAGEEGAPAATPSPSPTATASPPEPKGAPLSKADIATLAAAFADQPLTGGQTAPRLYQWVNDQVAVFLQFDDRDPAKATALRYVGISVKGVFCAEKYWAAFNRWKCGNPPLAPPGWLDRCGWPLSSAPPAGRQSGCRTA